MIPPEIYTFTAVFLGSIAGGIIVTEYALHRGNNMIANGIRQAIMSALPFLEKFLSNKQVNSIIDTVNPQPKRKPDDYE